MPRETSKLFHVVDASGTDYFVVADNLGDAFEKFKRWLSGGDDPAEWEDPQSIHEAGELIPS